MAWTVSQETPQKLCEMNEEGAGVLCVKKSQWVFQVTKWIPSTLVDSGERSTVRKQLHWLQ